MNFSDLTGPVHLLDINVLLARSDPGHVHHNLACKWMAAHAAVGWYTCPLTENGFIRILSHPSYPNRTQSAEHARKALEALVLHIPGHSFLAADVTVLAPGLVPDLTVTSSKNLTDLYLLALSARHNARFVTFDRKIDPTAVAGGPQAYTLLSPETP